jgi:DNA polymerase-3 subunit gamma/tau
VAEALYLRYRPQDFDDVVGQDHITITLRNQIAADRIGHAYLFVGSRGSGKTTCARIFAKEINLRGRGAEDRERIGRAVAEGRALDLIEIDAASHTGVDSVREIIDKVNFHAAELDFKVYIIDEVHMLSIAAFNALLKTLEEPPAHVVFILATTDPQKIPVTVLSRCQRFTFKRVPVDKIVGRLRHICAKESIESDDHALTLIARHATGALRDAVNLLDQIASANSGRITAADVREALGATDGATVRALTAGIATGDVAAGFETIQSALDQGSDARQIAKQMVEHLRALMQAKVRGGSGAPQDAEQIELSAQAEKLGMGVLSRAIRAFSAAQSEMRGGTDAQLAVEMAYLECVAIELVQAAPAASAAQRTDSRPHAPAVEQSAPAQPVQPAQQVQSVQSVQSSQPPQFSQPAQSTQPAQRAAPSAQAQDVSTRMHNGWRGFVQDVRRTNTTLQALLNSCKPQQIVGNVVHLKADHDLVRQRLQQSEKNGADLRRALSEWLGIQAEVNIYVEAPTPDPNEDPLLQAARRHGGQVRGTGDKG